MVKSVAAAIARSTCSSPRTARDGHAYRRKRAGHLVHSANFGGKSVEIYANGYVRVAMFMRDAVPYQKLISIQVESNIQKKTGPGRVVAAGMTFGANLVLTPNKRGDIYLTIVTEGDVYALRASPPTIQYQGCTGSRGGRRRCAEASGHWFRRAAWASGPDQGSLR